MGPGSPRMTLALNVAIPAHAFPNISRGVCHNLGRGHSKKRRLWQRNHFLETIRQGRTVLIVSHRVSSVKDADHIVVLDDGAIVESGTHEQLVARKGYYADLYRRQTIEDELEEIA